jgi:hypothetical protein
LADAVRKHGGKNWKRIAEELPGRTDVQCLHRWQKVLNPSPSRDLGLKRKIGWFFIWSIKMALKR